MMLKILSVFGFTFFALSSVAHADGIPQVLGEYGDWTAYYYTEGNSPVCYISSMPKKSEGKYSRRGDTYIYVTHRPTDKTFGTITFVAGYNFKQNSNVTVKIGTQTFNDLFVDGDKAWTMSSDIDLKIVESMKKHEKMIVHGTSSKGTNTKDTYSLLGFSKAYRTISAKCKK